MELARLLGLKYLSWISHREHEDAVPNLISAFRLSAVYQAPMEDLFAGLMNAIRTTNSTPNVGRDE